MSYRVKNWRQFQHYSDRNPPWIKLHFSMLSSMDWVTLDDASRVLAVACMLIASRNEGVVPSNPEYIRRVAYLNKSPNFKPLIDCGFLEPASDCKQTLAEFRPETETETETETTLSGKPDVAPKTKETTETARRVIDFLNAKTGKAFRPVPANINFVVGRLKEGATEQDCKSVIARKTREWKGTEQAMYLRPETLFNATKFAQYVGELVEPTNPWDGAK